MDICTHNAEVGGSIPPVATRIIKHLWLLVLGAGPIFQVIPRLLIGKAERSSSIRRPVAVWGQFAEPVRFSARIGARYSLPIGRKTGISARQHLGHPYVGVLMAATGILIQLIDDQIQLKED